ncbi:MAG: DUF4198 domain-containing protein [Shimia sp.]
MFRALTLLAFTVASPALGHEFWISPQAYTVEVGEPVLADIRVGQGFKGGAHAYFPRQTTRYDIATPDGVVTPDATLGDRPGVQPGALPEGLNVVVFETTDSRLTYREWHKFINFVEEKALEVDGVDGITAHRARDLPETGFVETYRRYAKSLVAVGNGEGADSPVGLRTEIVALANPYTDDLTDGLPIQVLLDGAPRADAQVELYAKAIGAEGDFEADLTVLTTDAEGRVTLPVTPGMAYMADAVVLEEGEDDAAWHSLWANLTFAVPQP